MVVEQWEEAAGADKAAIFVTFSSLEHVLDGLRSMTDILYRLALAILGVGIALSTVYPRWLGWTVIGVGVAWTVVGFVIGVAGSSSDLDIPFAIVFVLTVLWHLVMGVVVVRREIQAK